MNYVAISEGQKAAMNNRPLQWTHGAVLMDSWEQRLCSSDGRKSWLILKCQVFCGSTATIPTTFGSLKFECDYSKTVKCGSTICQFLAVWVHARLSHRLEVNFSKLTSSTVQYCGLFNLNRGSWQRKSHICLTYRWLKVSFPLKCDNSHVVESEHKIKFSQ